MELNFNSVETIPVLNASAAFKTDSGKVFKEDVDIVPVIIDKTLSYVPWGGDNEMPYVPSMTAATMVGMTRSIALTATLPRSEYQIFESGDSGIRTKNSRLVSSRSGLPRVL